MNKEQSKENIGNREQKDQKSDYSFDELKNTITTSHDLKELNESLEQQKLRIEYSVKKGAKIYRDINGTQVLCQCPGEIFLQTNAIDLDQSNQEFLCVTYGDKRARIKKQDLISCKGKNLDELYPPTTEKVIRVDKAKRMMTVYDQYGKHKVKEFAIALSPGEHGDKTIRGDNCTPEGKYTLCTKRLSNYGLNPQTFVPLQGFQINYPNSQDAFEGLISGNISSTEFNQINASVSQGVLPPQNTKLGNQIMIHGGGDYNDRENGDWTAGCIALNDKNMMWLLSFLGTGTDIYIE